MDTLKNKSYAEFDYLSRYINTPYYFDTLTNKEVFGIGTNMINTTEYYSHRVSNNDTLDNLALRYYNNPTFWWVIAYFNDIPDAFIKLSDRYAVLKIPSIASVEFGRINK